MRKFLASQRRIKPGTVFVLMVALIGGMGIGLVPYGYQMTRSPVIVDSLNELDGVAIRGGAIDLLVDINHRRACPTDAKRWLWRNMMVNGQMTQQWVFLNTPSSPPVPIGLNVHYVLSIPLPSAIEAGTWFYKSEVTDLCTWLPDFLTRRPRNSQDVPIMITEPTRAKPAAVSAPPGATLLLPEGTK